jgi:tRNA-binding EMAP/Myf-like protein
MLQKNFVPEKPFPNFKWKWASKTPSEGLNDPVVLLGVLFRMRKLEEQNCKYNSEEFARELRELEKDIKDSIDSDTDINLVRSTERNLIRNSGQYWRAVGLLESGHSGKIELTNFGRMVADRNISQTEFAAITIQTFKLPNPQIQDEEECKQWLNYGLEIYPLRIILEVLRELQQKFEQSYITKEELIRIVIPLSGVKAEIKDYVNFILWFRTEQIRLDEWPNCIPEDNDHRIAREYLIFLSNYGYVNCIEVEGSKRMKDRYVYNAALDIEIAAILATTPKKDSSKILIKSTIDIASEIERKRIEAQRSRPNQARFRKEVLQNCKRCIITNVKMPEVLEAAHIKPVKYKGDDTIANGFAMRTDIHLLFDTGHLRISGTGDVQLSPRAREDYGATVPPRIILPDYTNKEFIKWRWDNYNGI